MSSNEIRMPQLAEGMEDGTLLTWLKQAGDHVQTGEDLLEVETDKATIVYQAEFDGCLRPLVAAGVTVSVGTVIGRLVDDREDLEGGESSADEIQATVGEPTERSRDTRIRVQASPVARQLARQHGLDLAALTGSARGGGIVRADVDAALRDRGGRAVPGGLAPADVDRKGPPKVVQLSRREKLIALRMVEAKTNIPEFAVSTEVDVEEAVRLRAGLSGQMDPLPSINDILVKACGLALREHPKVNGAYRDGALELYPEINVGIAVATADLLVVPTIFGADRLPLDAIASVARALAERVRDGSISPGDLADGTFTISNLGMFGVTRIFPIIHGGQAGILGAGAATARAVPRADGSFEARRMMELTITGDHRILYGADAAAFLATLRDLLEAPARLLL